MPILIRGLPIDFSDLPAESYVTVEQVLQRRFTKTNQALTSDIAKGKFPKAVTDKHSRRHWLVGDIQRFYAEREKANAEQQMPKPTTKAKSSANKKGKR